MLDKPGAVHIRSVGHKERIDAGSQLVDGKPVAFVHCDFKDVKFILRIEDNGVGFDRALLTKGNGFNNMASRCEALQGKMTVPSEPGKGTRLSFSIPESILK